MKKPATTLASMPFIVLVFLVSFFSSINLYAQQETPGNRIAKKVAELKQQGVFKQVVPILAESFQAAPDREIAALIRKYTSLTIYGSEKISRDKPASLNFKIPVDGTGKRFSLALYREDISPNGFTLLTSDGNTTASQEIVHYRGMIDGDNNSVAAFTFSNNEVTGFINNKDGNYVIGRTAGATVGFIIYNDKDLVAPEPFDCATNTFIPLSPVTTLAKPATAAAVATKCVNWYWETDYDMFVNKGSVDNVNAYMQALFNQMATLYANDGMTMNLKTLYVWTATDPYTGPTTSDYLNQFGAYRTSFDGDLAHLIGLKGSGGIAWIKGLCKSTKYKMAYSGISSTYKAVPTYSWSVECITHEQGHLLGSPHTHDCAWNGNNTKIDGCGDAAGYSSGSCAVPSSLPSGGGTIMSYCHLTSAGINFNLGFGPQPTELMINTINASSCLTTCGGCTVPAQPAAITGNTAVCPGTSQTYSVATVAGATSYTWVLPSGWTGTSTTNSITVTAGNAGGTISVTAVNSCGSSTARTATLTITSAIPSQPGTIAGSSTVCAGSAQTYSIAAVAGASSYTWVLPSGWTGTSTTNSITATAGTTGGSISVAAKNGCGTSAARTATITTTALPAAPGAITVSGGTAAVCSGDTRTYTVPLVSGVSYAWTLPAGATATGSQNANSIQLSFSSSFVSGSSLSVKAVNSCGSSAAGSSITISKNTITTPGTITVTGGTGAVCSGDTRTYTVPLVSGITYNWTAPTGGNITSGQGTNSIVVNYTLNFTASGTVGVTANNNCGASAARTLAVTKNNAVPATPGVINGSTVVCANAIRSYYISGVQGATSYLWTIPAGSVMIDSTPGFIRFRYGVTSGDITVKAVNACGASAASTKAVTVNTGCTASIEENSIAKKALVYPNPARDRIFVNFNVPANSVYTISIMDIAGKTVIKQRRLASAGTTQHSFNVAGFSKGTYLINIESTSGKEVLKVNIE
ncbi:MAG: M12 family metallo-peptidase [Ferruginibacter sp.]